MPKSMVNDEDEAFKLAQAGLRDLKLAIVEILERYPEGLTNAQVAETLGLRSSYRGGSKDYLSWSILGLLLDEGRVKRLGRKYLVFEQPIQVPLGF